MLNLLTISSLAQLQIRTQIITVIKQVRLLEQERIQILLILIWH